MIEERLQELRGEYTRGKVRADALEREQKTLRETMLRIAGAIQVLEELLARQRAVSDQPGTENGAVTAEAG